VSASSPIGKLKTLEGSVAIVNATDGRLTVNGFPVTSELAATNGLVHSIDNVLIPPDIDITNLPVTPTVSVPAAPTTSTTAAPATTTATTTGTTVPPTTLPKPVHAGAGADFFVYFPNNDAVLDDAANAVIAEAAAKIQTLPANSKVVITGYADINTVGAQKGTLSKERADAVKAALEAAGAKANFQVVAHGDVWETQLAQARRAEINLP
jgi:outer membrane protein OmpA-like peptidoglycan-associated protein